MEWLNYHHLLYFWAVARRGSVSRAAEELRLAQPTLSGQIRALEDALGEKLFQRVGRGLVLTEFGQLAFRYADEIFSLGRELQDVMKGHPSKRGMRLLVGVADVVPKLIAFRLLQPARQLPEPVRIVCHEDKPDRLFAELALHSIDLVISDAPLPASVNVRAFSHLLGECGVVIMGTKELVQSRLKTFPKSLDGAPFLLPTENTMLRRSLDRYFDAEGITPKIEGEFEDSALIKVFAQSGAGLLAVPATVEDQVRKQYELRTLGRVDSVRERFYAITVERRLKHPAVVAISEAARHQVFG